ncbi:non-muscle cofilin 1-like [Electrophorus electricus]|uniref:ADF-H domain-containing protein n=1 Tax=Electrophorus electricus TaxID=8005 RepID=A0A4W4H3G8_ELEEL|nr:non-muscle cofilin 1-like [Electrophorus electricus]
MASGVAISDEVVKHFEQIRVRYHGSEEKERFKLVIMRLSEDKKSIVVDHKCSLKIKDLEKEADIFKKIISMLPDCDCRYCLYDCFYKTKESSKQDLVFIMWAPDSASMQNKMVYASSKVALKAKFQGLKFEWQVNDPADKDLSCLIERLGGKDVIEVEGKCV